MTYGITGNTKKAELWPLVADLMAWMKVEGIPFRLDALLQGELTAQDALPVEVLNQIVSSDLSNDSDVILSIGGDGTLLNTAYQIGARETPILGVNIGRLGFLADTEANNIKDAIRLLERNEYRIQSRMVLEANLTIGGKSQTHWALNDIVLAHSSTELISVDVKVNGAPLTTYWADGLIISTPTGSTAYSLSIGGPILVPDCGAVLLTPLAPHTLTVRPLVVPDSATIEIEVLQQPYAFAADGRSNVIDEAGVKLTIRRASHHVKLIKLPDQDYFQTLRNKLRWSGR